jgi:hypothetical protein
MKYSLAIVFALVLALSLGGQVFAQTQMTVMGIKYDAGTPELSVIDQDHWVAIADLKGVKIDTTTGKGPLNNMASDTKLVLYGDKTGVHYLGYLTFSDKDGDKIVVEARGNEIAFSKDQKGQEVREKPSKKAAKVG